MPLYEPETWAPVQIRHKKFNDITNTVALSNKGVLKQTNKQTTTIEKMTNLNVTRFTSQKQALIFGHFLFSLFSPFCTRDRQQNGCFRNN